MNHAFFNQSTLRYVLGSTVSRALSISRYAYSRVIPGQKVWYTMNGRGVGM